MEIIYLVYLENDENSPYVLREEYASDNFIDREVRQVSRERNISYFLALKEVIKKYIDSGSVKKFVVRISASNVSIETDTSKVLDWNSFFIYKTYISEGGSEASTYPEYIGLIHDGKLVEIDVLKGKISRIKECCDAD